MTGEMLKLLALVAMTADHIGVVLFPQTELLRLVGRLAFPIFAFLIAEGCRYTRHMGKYLGKMGLMAAVCQGVYFFAMGSVYQCVLVTFSLSIGLIWLVQTAQKKPGFWGVFLLGLGAVYFLTVSLPGLLDGTDYAVDYGLWGVLLPVAVYLGRTKWERLGLCALMLTVLALDSAPIQFYSLLSLPILSLYNGKRGKGLGKYFFYLYYPVHLAVLQGIAWILPK